MDVIVSHGSASDLDQFRFVKETWQDYVCGKCRNLLRNAVQTTCGHWLCESCVEDLFYTEYTQKIIARCPNNVCNKQLGRSDGTKYFPDQYVRRNIKELEVVCLFPACGWTGQYQQFYDHYKVQHLVYAVKPELRGLACEAVVDFKKFEAMASTNKQVKKLSKEILIEKQKLLEKEQQMSEEIQSEKQKILEREQQLSHVVEELSKTIDQQVEDADPVRVEVTERVESAAQSTASLGRAGEQPPNERSSTLNADRSDELLHLEINPVTDYPSAIPQADTTSKPSLVTGAGGSSIVSHSSSTGAHSNSTGAHSHSPVKEKVVLKRKGLPGNKHYSDHTLSPPPSPRTQNTSQDSLLPPIVNVTRNSRMGSPMRSPPRSPTSAVAEVPSPRMRRHRRHSSLPVINPSAQLQTGRKQATASASAHSGSRRHQLIPRTPLATINGNDEGNGRTKSPSAKSKCHSLCQTLRSKLEAVIGRPHGHQCTPDGHCYQELVMEIHEFVDDHENGDD